MSCKQFDISHARVPEGWGAGEGQARLGLCVLSGGHPTPGPCSHVSWMKSGALARCVRLCDMYFMSLCSRALFGAKPYAQHLGDHVFCSMERNEL